MNWTPETVVIVSTAIITAITAGIVRIILALKDVSSQVQALEIKVDGRLTQLLERTAMASRSEGLEAGRGEMVVPVVPARPRTPFVDPAKEHLVVEIPVPMPPVVLLPTEGKPAPEQEK